MRSPYDSSTPNETEGGGSRSSLSGWLRDDAFQARAGPRLIPQLARCTEDAEALPNRRFAGGTASRAASAGGSSQADWLAPLPARPRCVRGGRPMDPEQPVLPIGWADRDVDGGCLPGFLRCEARSGTSM
eukprot:TRINITY_DN21379_c0_g1_i1.p1 TRINITY_DN21379_c0_g1~~TRINITY_DN21379_c0_g1_i1.p1  ORF type:complete len:130 (-),score=9.43 TRINITY_DN21379_c0_g1_i1:23-412(-)